ncbi:MAG: hypothetical protein JKY68_02775 [Rhodospirillales bacterium]|nr:hypothetical protein [Rhodospirillales bacterium]
MTNELRAIDIGNRTYQQQMANSLSCSLGMDGASDPCTRNNWTGTASLILKEEKRSRS